MHIWFAAMHYAQTRPHQKELSATPSLLALHTAFSIPFLKNKGLVEACPVFFTVQVNCTKRNVNINYTVVFLLFPDASRRKSAVYLNNSLFYTIGKIKLAKNDLFQGP